MADTDFRTSGLHVFDRKVLDTKGLMTFAGRQTYPEFTYGNWYGVHYHHISNQPKGYGKCLQLLNPALKEAFLHNKTQVQCAKLK